MANTKLCLATLNLWHGLSFDSKLRFGFLEPKTRRKLREERQVELLKQLDADIYFLQEANPLWDRSLDLSEQLQRTAFEKTDLAGVKIFGLGFPLNLNSGLVTLVRESWSPRLVDAPMLSGPKGSSSGTFYSLQFDECRYAILVEALHPTLGRLLIVNTHLHHGLEWKDSYKSALEEWIKKYDVSQSVQEELGKRFKAANTRRNAEITKLLKYVSPYRDRYKHIILGGDLNFSPDSECYQRLLDFGFGPKNSSEEPSRWITWDPVQNKANHHFQKQFPPTVFIEDLTFSKVAKEELIALIRVWEQEPRQMDYVLMTGEGLGQLKFEIFGRPGEEHLAPSDHFGLLLKGPLS